MTAAKPISILRSSDLLDQKPSTISCLSKKELAELHATSTSYPSLDHCHTHAQSLLDAPSHGGSQKTVEEKMISSLAPMREGSHNAKLFPVEKAHHVKEPAILKKSDSWAVRHDARFQEGEEHLHFYEEKNEDSAFNKDEAHQDLDHLVSPSSLAGGAAAWISSMKPSQTSPPAFSLEDGSALSPVAAAKQGIILASENVGDDGQALLDSKSVSSSYQDSLEGLVEPFISKEKVEDNMTSLFQAQASDHSEINADQETELEKQADGTSAYENKGAGGDIRNLEVSGKVTDHDAGGHDDFQGMLREHEHEAMSNLGSKESKGNAPTIVKPLMAQAELSPITGSAGSSNAKLSEPVAAALRVTHLLDELTATVSRLRLENNNGKEMTIQLRRDVLADTDIHIVSSAKQMEVSFLTSNAASNGLLNTHLTTLQNHLNALCPGQVVNIQTQLTPSGSSSHLGGEQDHSQDDLASFDQGNRGNFSNDEDTL